MWVPSEQKWYDIFESDKVYPFVQDSGSVVVGKDGNLVSKQEILFLWKEYDVKVFKEKV